MTMSATRLHSPRLPRVMRRLSMGGASLALLLALAGVIAMHGVDPVAAARATGSIAAHHAVGGRPAIEHSHHNTDSKCHHSDSTHEHCPHDSHQRHGQVCQSGALTSAVALPALTSTFNGPAREPRLSVTTAADDAGLGSGCGPPSLIELSISRT